METDRFDDLEVLFEQALALPEAARPAFIDAAGLADPALRAELAALLDAQDGASDFLHRLAEDLPFPLPGKTDPKAADSREADPMVGTRVGPYLVLERLGEGGMGVVYRAEDTRLQRNVALKFLARDLSRHRAAAARFRQEALAAAALDHPNICTVYEVGEGDDGRPFIAMAYCAGVSLKARLRDDPMPVAEAIEVARQMARGLAKAHAEGIIHRDVKPGNVMLTPDALVKIVDFGLAKRAANPLTRTGATMGTVAYMSPEQVRGESVDARSDTWSLGVVMYEMLAGTRPFHGPYEQALLYAVLNEAPRPLAEHAPDLPEDLARLVEQCLRKNPAERPADAALGAALDALAVGHPAPAFAPPPGTSSSAAADASSADAAAEKSGSSFLYTLTHLSFREKALGGVFVAALILLVSMLPWRGWADRVFEGGAGYHLAVLPFTTVGEVGEAAYVEGLRLAVTRLMTEMGPDAGMPLAVMPAAESGAVSTAAEARTQLGVDHVVTGTLVEAGASVRLELALVDARRRRQLRTATLTAPAGEGAGATMQAGLVGGVAEVLGVTLSADARERLTAGQTGNAKAYDLYLRGLALLEHPERPENIDAARQLFGFALDEDPGYARVHAALGRAYWTKYDHTKDTTFLPLARASAERALALDPRLPEAQITLGQLHFGRGRYEEAIGEYTLALALDPGNADAYRRIALAYERLGRDHDAEGNYRKAIEARPEYYRPYNWLGIFYAQRKRYEEAIAQFERVVELIPQETRGYNNLGFANKRKGDLATARQWYERSLALQPSYSAYLNLGTIAYEEKNYAEEAQMYEQALALDATRYAVWGNLASAYYRLRDPRADSLFQRAIAMAGQAYRVNPASEELRADLAIYTLTSGKLAVRADRVEEGVERFEQAARLGADLSALASDTTVTARLNPERLQRLIGRAAVFR